MKSKWKIHLGATHRAVGFGPFHPFSVDLYSFCRLCVFVCVCPFSEGDCQPVRLPSTPPSLVLLSLHFWHPPDIRCSARTHTHTCTLSCIHSLLATSSLTSCQFILLQKSFLDGVNKHRICPHIHFGEVACIKPLRQCMKILKDVFLFWCFPHPRTCWLRLVHTAVIV